MTLAEAWNRRDKLRAEGDKLYAEGDKLRAEGDKLYAEGSKLRAEGSKLRAEGDTQWAQAVIDAHGPTTTMLWEDDDGMERCVLGTGEVFRRVTPEFWTKATTA